MRLWGALYGMIWLLLLEFLLELAPQGGLVLLALHLALGAGIVVLAYANFRALRATRVPGRVKRISRSTFQLSVATLVLGGFVLTGLGDGVTIAFGETVTMFALFLHVLLGFAIITQAAATAIAYDMWEDREFDRLTEPGEIPPPPTPVTPVRPVRD